MAKRTPWLTIGLVAVLLAPTAAEGSLPKEFRTVNHQLHSAISPSDLDRMESARVSATRITLFWPAVEAAEDRYNWAQPDAMVGGLASRGIQPLPILFGSPGWTRPDDLSSSNKTPPLGSQRAREAWQQYVRLAVQRYGRDGTFWREEFSERYPGAQPQPIRLWQVWNEPNLASFAPRPDPKRYGRLLRLSEEAIHGVEPGARIALAGLPGSVRFAGWDFLNRLYRVDGAKPLFDVVALHDYSAEMWRLRASLARFREVMRQNGDRRTGIWVSEMGYGSGRNGYKNLGRRGQAKALRQAFRTVRKHRREFAISRVSLFNWRDPSVYAGACEWCPRAGLFTAEGVAKPSWRTYLRLTQMRRR